MSATNIHPHFLSNEARYGLWILDIDEDDRNYSSTSLDGILENQEGLKFPAVLWDVGQQGTVTLPVLIPTHEEENRDPSQEISGTVDLFMVYYDLEERRYSRLSSNQVCQTSQLEHDTFPDKPVAGNVVFFRHPEDKVAFQVQYVEDVLGDGEAKWVVVLDRSGCYL